jgi:hypothetical protein
MNLGNQATRRGVKTSGTEHFSWTAICFAFAQKSMLEAVPGMEDKMKMEMKHKFAYLSLFVILLLSLSSCNFPGLQPTPDQFATAAAETVSAQLTQSSDDTPVVVEDTATPEPPEETEIVPSDTPEPTASPTVTCTDEAKFSKDVTVPDNTRMDPGEEFEKIWRLENVGTCPWTENYSIVFDSGNIMDGPPSITLGTTVEPGGTIDISIPLTAPLTNGTHKGNWLLRNTKGLLFGLGDDADAPFWVIIVVGPTPTPQPESVYSFVDHYCDASWVSGAGALPCPGTESDATGFVVKKNDPRLENGSIDDEVALFTHPQWVNDGVISGRFPAIDVVEGDHFRAVIGCLYNSGGSACEVKFQVTYHADGGSLKLLGQWEETYDGTIRKLDIDLADEGLAGKSVEFSLVVLANGPSNQDWAFWLEPRIVGPPR